jgi:hypothetical protein
LSINEERLKFIPVNEVPIKKVTKWDELFKKVPTGQALVLNEAETNIESATSALRRRQRRGQFKHLRAVTKGRKGKRIAYIMNMGKS